MAKRTKFPSEEAERFQLRLPEGMRDRIRVAAEHSRRSMNAEIVARLESTFEKRQAEFDLGLPDVPDDGINRGPARFVHSFMPLPALLEVLDRNMEESSRTFERIRELIEKASEADEK